MENRKFLAVIFSAMFALMINGLSQAVASSNPVSEDDEPFNEEDGESFEEEDDGSFEKFKEQFFKRIGYLLSDIVKNNGNSPKSIQELADEFFLCKKPEEKLNWLLTEGKYDETDSALLSYLAYKTLSLKYVLSKIGGSLSDLINSNKPSGEAEKVKEAKVILKKNMPSKSLSNVIKITDKWGSEIIGAYRSVTEDRLLNLLSMFFL
ncbi:MAG: hypothetical protein LBB13_02395 [Rickettsiales bacterium]|jgi:hypothetical protein|nr:hypothetical protein [Rickettsiales bacterium]